MNASTWPWLNESRMIADDNEVVIHAPAYTDWFNNPVPEDGVISAPVANAPFLYTEVTGDFVFRAISMVRLFHLPVEKTVKVGIEAQSPAGKGGMRFYSHIFLENRTVQNLRAGV